MLKSVTYSTFLNKPYGPTTDLEFNVQAMHKFSFDMNSEQSSFIIINGPIGAGKSTFINTYFKNPKKFCKKPTRKQKEFKTNKIDIELSIYENFESPDDEFTYLIDLIYSFICVKSFNKKNKGKYDLKELTVGADSKIFSISATFKPNNDNSSNIVQEFARQIYERQIKTIIIEDLDRYGCCIRILELLKSVVNNLKNRQYDVKFVISMDVNKYDRTIVNKLCQVIEIDPYLTWDNFAQILSKVLNSTTHYEQIANIIDKIKCESRIENLDGRIIALINNEYYFLNRTNHFDIKSLEQAINNAIKYYNY